MAIRDTSVILYRHTDPGMPSVLNGLAGSTIPIFDAVLVDGGTPISVESLVVSNGIATLTRDGPHGFTCPGAAFGIDVGEVIEIAGVTGPLAALNRKWRATVTSTTGLTWECGLADGTAAGTITVRKPSLGFTKPFGSTYAATYRSGDSLGNQPDFYVDDSTGQFCRTRGFERATSNGAGTGPFPSDARVNGGYYWQKSATANDVARPWMIIGDARGFYVRFHNSAGLPPGYATNAFIEIVSDKDFDQYCTLITGLASATAGQTGAFYYHGAGWIWHTMARSYTQLGGDITVGKYSHGTQTSGSGNAAETIMPSVAGNRYLAASIDVWENANVRRGLCPGCYAPLNGGLAVQDGAVFRVKDSRENRILMHWRMTNAGSYFAHAFDLTGPWR